MSFKLSAAPLALLLAAASAPAFAQDAGTGPSVDLGEVIVTGAPNPEDPPVVAEASTPPSRRPVSLYADVRAYQTGDLLTVVLAERTSARRQSESSASEQRQIGGSSSTSQGGFFGLDASLLLGSFGSSLLLRSSLSRPSNCQ